MIGILQSCLVRAHASMVSGQSSRACRKRHDGWMQAHGDQCAENPSVGPSSPIPPFPVGSSLDQRRSTLASRWLGDSPNRRSASVTTLVALMATASSMRAASCS
ncbi:hypothetical protein J3458_004205 [Metarhizium acridum]|uniref:uncharacterized protein n=1 Tax=Metarhizium acridum TaxID=92637 RepID=UPI001C6B0335|nr:hypothetical protein J3458_004205 [Metarhizium acridum]